MIKQYPDHLVNYTNLGVPLIFQWLLEKGRKNKK